MARVGVRRFESKRMGIAGLADNALEGPNARVLAAGVGGRGVAKVGVKWAAERLGWTGQWRSLSRVATHSLR
jgi:hypothetical protein